MIHIFDANIFIGDTLTDAFVLINVTVNAHLPQSFTFSLVILFRLFNFNDDAHCTDNTPLVITITGYIKPNIAEIKLQLTLVILNGFYIIHQ